MWYMRVAAIIVQLRTTVGLGGSVTGERVYGEWIEIGERR